MNRPALLTALFCLVALLIGVPGFAQGTGGAASLSGTVVDGQGGVIPGATVEIRNMGTGTTETLVSNENGVFAAPALTPGLYTVTVSLNGFKTSVVSDVRLVAATASQLKVTLELGALAEVLEVKAHSSLVQTQSTTVQATMLAEQITKLPLVSRNGLAAVMNLPGVQQIGNYRNSTINGLPQNTISLTLDGIGIGNNLQSNDGFYTQVFPRLDAIEEVTVTGATPDAAGGAQGSVQVAFVTRSGTNTWNQSVYHYYRSPKFNTNYYFNEINNLEKNQVTVHQFGGRVGGPIVRNRAFFFFNYEQFYLPNEATRTRVLLGPDAQQGLFRYDVAGQIRQVNVLDLARTNGHAATSTVDPTINALLSSIRTAAGTTGRITDRTDLNTQQYVRLAPSERNEYAPTGRVDVNVFANHRVTGTYLWQRIVSKPDFLNTGEPTFPGFPNFTIQSSYRKTGSLALRSTFSSNMVNEFKTGFQSSPVDFYSELGAETFANQGGYAIAMPLGLDNAHRGNAPNLRDTPSINVENTLTWLRGKHSFSFGGAFTNIRNQSEAWNIVPGITIGLDQTNDPAAGIFTTANFPGASNGNLNDARALYALLTGRVTAITGTSRVNENGEYEYLGNLVQRASQNEFGAYVQDQWRLTPALTINAGVRWEVALPYKPTTPTYSTSTLTDLCGVSGVGSGPEGRQCNIFKPGTLAGAGVVPQYTLMDPDVPSFEPKYNNFGPNVGVAWRPTIESGWGRAILGDPDQATIRAGYAVSFNRERMDRFTGIFGNNPGGTTAANRNVANGNLVYPGQTWPVRFSETARLGPPATCPDNAITAACVPRAPIYPIRANVSNSLSIFDPELTLPYTRSWSIGLQRAITRDSVIEVLYLGNRNEHAWASENWNERNMVENGFMDEFLKARDNLRANQAAGRGNSFAYFGAGTGTSPLPIYLAYLTGSAAATDPARYSANLFSSTTWTQHLSLFNPLPQTAATNLDNDATRRTNALNAGLPANFFVMNPAVASANVMRASAGTRYHALQLQYRRRLSRGLLINASYTYARGVESSLETIHQPTFYIKDARTAPHAWKVNWTYDLPFGRGRRFGADMNRVLNAVAGGWELSGASRLQYEQFSVDSVRLVGMSQAELQDAFSIRQVRNDTTGVTTVFMMAQDIIDNTRRAFSVDPNSATGYSALGVPTGRYIAPASDGTCIALYPGDCGAPRQITLRGPLFVRFDLRGTKKFQLPGRLTVDLSFELMNLFDNINFNPTFNPGSGATIFQVTSAYRDTGVDVNDPGGRLGQVVWRVSW